MPRYHGKKTLNNDLFIRHLDGMRLLLHSLDSGGGKAEGDNLPPLDMFEASGTLVIEIDLPGFKTDEISIVIEGLSLTIEAFRPRENIDGTFICMERSSGRFRRSVHLPGSIDAPAITAEYSRGVLRILCPAAGGRLITIKENTVERT